MNHGDRSSKDEYYLPCIAIYMSLSITTFNSMNKPYVYFRSKLDDIFLITIN